MNTECGNQHITTFGTHTYCDRDRGHDGDHLRRTPLGSVCMRWPKAVTWEYTPEEDTVNLKLTLEELKGLVYALSGPEWLEDEPELVKKIDKALKEAL